MENDKPTINYMMDYVQDYLDGKCRRFVFELNFKSQLMELWEEMCEEDENLARAFKYYMSDNGFEAGDDLNDNEYKELIKRQYSKFIEKVEKVS